MAGGRDDEGGGLDTGAAKPEQAASNVMKTTPENQAATFRNQDQVWPHRVIRRGQTVRALPPHHRPLAHQAYEVGDAMIGLDDFMARRRTAGFLILKNGEIALERYGMGSGPESRWASFSIAKSMTATLVGAALHDGAIGSLDEACGLYVPQMRGSAYEDVTLRNLLRMASGVIWDEGDKSDGRDLRRLGQAMGSRRPGAILDLLRTLPRAAPQGAVFNYSTGESVLLGAVVAAATGRPLADYFAQTVWGPAGMEADGLWQLESEDGLELGGMGVSARLRDVGRFGLLVLEDGEAFDGRRVLPSGWRDLAGQPDCAATAFGRLMAGSPAGYGYHWWSLPGAPFADGLHAGAFLALGAFGQRIYLNPTEQAVAVIQSAWRQPHDSEAEAETVALLRTLIRALRP
ncbi:serine hydrolase [Phenylobacterium sp.]|uniref:serine hydrolase domain-containing protein n=1 Tax=Phenylobacterium sp. TaxID=1871053 RepID=UPI00286C24A1|nr:serine hydrolase [Phenylobacterium sp.]